jgi:hypothetical protein
LKLSGGHQLLVYADYVNIFGRSMLTVKKNTEAFVVTGKEISLEVNAEKTKYMVLSQDQNVGQNHNIKIHNKSFERVEQFRYLGTVPKNQSSIHEEIKSRLQAGNALYLVQNLLSSSLLFRTIKIKIHRTIIFCVVLCGCEASSLTLG